MTRRVSRGMWYTCAMMAAVVALASQPAQATVLYVPSDYARIQYAIDAAVDGDVVAIEDGKYTGAYNWNLDFGGKAITLRSTSGDPSQCVIDCNRVTRGFYFHSGEGPDSIVMGIMVTRGRSDEGAGVYCDNSSSPTLINCRLINNFNYYSDNGGGLYCTDSSHPTLTNCTIAGNSVFYEGGGIYCDNASSVKLTVCTISGNSSDHRGGGGIYCDNASHVEMNNCTVNNNTAYYGGGILCDNGSSIELNDCTISANTAEIAGGGLYIHDSTEIAVNCTFSENTTTFEGALGGGGLSLIGSTVTLANCTISGSFSHTYGGGVYCGGGDLTVTDCSIVGNQGRTGGGVFCGHTVASASFSGCTISGNTEGGGIWSQGCSPTFTNCMITDNSGNVTGGIHWYGGSPTITDCTISRNTVTEGSGGGVFYGSDSSAQILRCTISDNVGKSGGGVYSRATGGSTTFTDCTISGNVARGEDGEGGGVLVWGNAPLTLTNCKITDNSALGGSGGGINCPNSYVTIDRCTISRNTSQICGGGISLRNGPKITNCTISDNRTVVSHSGTYGGGGIFCASSSRPLIANCLIIGNKTVSQGGGVCALFSSPQLINCTVAMNSASEGGGISCDGFTPSLTNCILWGNSPNSIGTYLQSASPATYCNIQGGAGEVWFGTGCIDTNPLFAFADDFHLTPESPCLDAGTNEPDEGLPANDLDGNPRPIDGDDNTVATADMGAYEFNPESPSMAVSPGVLKLTALEGDENTAEQILSVRNCGGETLNWEITEQPEWVSVSPSSGTSAGEVNEVSVVANVTDLPHGVYTATLEVSSPDAINPQREVAIEVYVTNVWHVPGDYSTIQEAIDAAIPSDVIEIADGTYTGAGNKNLSFHGKAITVRSESGDPSQCVIDCENDGRGFLFNSYEGRNSVVEGLTITNANSDEDGGAVYCRDSSPTLIGCSITNSLAEQYGGGIYCRNSEATLIGCKIAGNSATHNHGGGLASFGGRITIDNCLIIENTTNAYGGGVYLESSDSIIGACTFVGNSAEAYGGGFAAWESQPTITNCIFSGGSPADLSMHGESHDNVNYCLVPNAISGPWVGDGVIDADPMFIDPDGPDGDPDTWEDNNYRLAPGSPCIDAGHNASLPSDTFDLDNDGDTTEPIPFDIDGLSRFFDDAGVADTGLGTAPLVDMGAYESHTTTGDSDGNGAVDLDDFEVFHSCTSGPGNTIDEECQASDFDLDGDVDLEDFVILQRALAVAQ